MKNIKKLIAFTLMFLGLIGGTSLLNVNAETAPSTVTMKAKSSLYYFSETSGTDYISGYNFYRKQLKGGTYAYCVSNIDTKVPAGMTMSSKGPNQDNGLDYIIKNGYPTKSFTGDAKKDYYITQSAIWEYFDQTRGSNNWGKTSFSSSSTGMKKYVYNLVQGAKAAKKIADPVPSITASISDKNMLISSDGKYYVSRIINVSLNNTIDTYTVELQNAPSGTILKNSAGTVKTTFNKGEGFYVYAPIEKVTKSTNIKIVIKTDGVIKKTYYYAPTAKGYQYITPVTPYDIISHIQTDLTLNIEKQITKLKVSKQDITTKEELPGATLTIKDSTGKVVDTWVSTKTPHYIENLAAGKYTLTEKIAPEGYVLSSETIEFTLKADGTTTTVVMFNTKEKETTKYKISKQDITTKEELPGATLTIKDSTGKVIDRWVSGNVPHYVTDLKVGKYTLTEEIAPEGYVLSSETIEFTVEKDGKIKTVVMFNEKEIVTKVKISKQDIATKEELPGATLTIKDSTGKVVEKWVSGDAPHYVEGLKAGKYTLTEEIAPEGYILSSETIEFTVKADGSVTSVVMYNARKTEVTKVKISKQDITTKEELPGATLTIKDSTGKVVEKWVSGSEPHYIEGLEAGDYTLTEEIAPEGYVLSSETIKFTVKADGSVTSVVMYNEKWTEVPITDLNISSATIIIAGVLISLGTGLVFYAKHSF